MVVFSIQVCSRPVRVSQEKQEQMRKNYDPNMLSG